MSYICAKCGWKLTKNGLEIDCYDPEAHAKCPKCGHQEFKMAEEKKKYFLVIQPAIPPKDRHKIEAALKECGYNVYGGGTYESEERSDISFEEQ